jgi:ATP-dependent DNA helicase RecQ
LRSKTIERLIRKKIVRFVIDEAHCFSSWGQDLELIIYTLVIFKTNSGEENIEEAIPISCFTATAKKK